MKYNIIKQWKHLRIYTIINEKGEIIEEFDEYNHQKPHKQALEKLKELNNK